MDSVSALPGWMVQAGTNVVPYVLYDGEFLDSTGVSILDGGRYSYFPPPVEGIYEILLQGGVRPPWLQHGPTYSFDRMPASIAQTGLIPAIAKSIRFHMWSDAPSLNLAISIDGQAVPVVLLDPGARLYGVDASSWSGNTAELKFSAIPPPQNAPTDIYNVILDGIEFSPNAVPEPNSMALFLFAAGFASLLEPVKTVVLRRRN